MVGCTQPEGMPVHPRQGHDFQQDDTVLGKLRIRLSTLRPWEEIQCTLPMLSDRDKGGTKVGQAHISLKVSPSTLTNQLHLQSRATGG